MNKKKVSKKLTLIGFSSLFVECFLNKSIDLELVKIFYDKTP